MRHGRVILCALFLFFVVLAGRSLVRGPAGEKPQMVPVSAGESAFLVQVTGEQPEAGTESSWHGGPREHARTENVRSLLPLPSLAGDGNGQLLSRWTWHRSVYWVCPPEGMPG